MRCDSHLRSSSSGGPRSLPWGPQLSWMLISLLALCTASGPVLPQKLAILFQGYLRYYLSDFLQKPCVVQLLQSCWCLLDLPNVVWRVGSVGTFDHASCLMYCWFSCAVCLNGLPVFPGAFFGLM